MPASRVAASPASACVQSHLPASTWLTVFGDRFRARVGPVWNTQNVAQPPGTNWANTWFTGHYFQKTQLYETPPWDLLLYYGARNDCRLHLSPVDGASPETSRLTAVQYAWEGDVAPGTRLQFVELLLPHRPMRDASRLAAAVTVLRDEPGLAAARVTSDEGVELALVNPAGKAVELESATNLRVATDARAAYVQVRSGRVVSALAVAGTSLRAGSDVLLQSVDRRDAEVVR